MRRFSTQLTAVCLIVSLAVTAMGAAPKADPTAAALENARVAMEMANANMQDPLAEFAAAKKIVQPLENAVRAAQAVQDAAQDVVDRLTEWKTANAAVNQTKTDMTNARNAVAGKAGAALDTALFSLRKAVEAYNEAQKKLEEAKRNLPPTYVIPADIALVDVDITLAQAEVTKAAKAVADAEAEVTKAKAKTRHDEKEAAFNAVKALFDAAVENWTRLKRTVDGGGDGKASAVIEQKLDTVNAKLASLETAVTTHDTSVKGAFV
ncbi:hypothetical protein KJ652_04285, partial [Patescibacteria group bacterium]|nr:hypothetical protein [Patescibacteria group bacterium]